MDSSKASILGASVVFVVAAFVMGVQVGERRVVPTDGVPRDLVNTEGDILTAQVGANTDAFDFTPYWRVWNTLERKFAPYGTTTAVAMDPESRVYSSIEGLVNSYGDPYTVFMRPQVAENFKISTKGSLEGIGAVIGEYQGGLVVVSPLVDSPAEKAGLVSGDKILKVDDVTTEGETVDQAVDRIRGERGTEVKLLIQSVDEEPRDVYITRGTIEIPSTAHTVVAKEVPKVAVSTGDTEPDGKVESASSDGGDSGEESSSAKVSEDKPFETEVKDFYVLQLFSFSQTSINAFQRELEDFKESGSDSLIIDLRGNPGGYIESAVQIASWFLHDGDVVVREYHGPEKREVVHYAQNRNLFDDELPKVAVLVNKGSASAAEILAGALQEHGVATIVGTNTFGKGSVQELVNITDNLALKVTVARWYTPNGISISQGGLTPDVQVDTNATSSDPWIDAAVEALTTS